MSVSNGFEVRRGALRYYAQIREAIRDHFIHRRVRRRLHRYGEMKRPAYRLPVSIDSGGKGVRPTGERGMPAMQPPMRRTAARLAPAAVLGALLLLLAALPPEGPSPRVEAAPDPCRTLVARSSGAQGGAASQAPGQVLQQSKCVRLNEIQVLGTHNSYHVQPEPALLAALSAFDPLLPLSLEYTHPDIGVQLSEQGVRQIELDVFADPEGGLYALRRGLAAIGGNPVSGIPELSEPGFKVLHTQDIDFGTNCLTLVRCLERVREWSDAHPGHLPVMVLVEFKTDPIPDPLGLGFTVPLPATAALLDDLDAEIRSVFTADRLITPDDVRGGHATLEQAILQDGWPTLEEARGRVIFALDNPGVARTAYIAGRPSLEGRVMFTSSTPSNADAAFVQVHDPIAQGAAISELVEAGYLVRTRADVDTLQARTGDTSRRDAALASGAQFVSTDYVAVSPFGTGYQVVLPGGLPARCNPVNAPEGCRDAALENLDARGRAAQ